MTLRVGMVGAGRAGFRRAHRLKGYPDVEITAIAEPNRPAREEFAKTFGATLSVADHRRLGADDDVDVVCVCSPPATRSAISIDLLDVGKHVICEQPMALTIAETEEMMVAAESSQSQLCIALPHRYDPVNQEVARLIDEDEIGYPFLVLATFLENDFDRLNDWHHWKGTWEIGGGGILMQRGSEIFDLLRYLLGEVDAVSALCTRFAIEPLNKAEDSCLLSLEFLEESTADISLSGATRYSPWPEDYQGVARRIEIYGLDGSIRISDSEPRLTMVTRRSKNRVIDVSEIDTKLPTDMDRDFLDSIIEGTEPLATMEHAREALRIVLAGYKSSQMKRRVEILEDV